MFPILSVGVANSVFFGTYGNVMRLIQIQRDDSKTNKNIDVRFCYGDDNLHKYWHFDIFISGCIAGLSYALINTPIEVIKTLLQARSKPLNTKIYMMHTNILGLDISTFKREYSKEAEPLLTTTRPTSAYKLMIELYKINGIRSLYRGGTLLFIRFIKLYKSRVHNKIVIA